MPLDIIANFYDMVNLPVFDSVSVILIVSFLVWEIPRAVKIISEEYTKGLYPEGGRVPDYFLLIAGIAAAAFILTGSNGEEMVRYIKTPGVSAIYLILMLTIPLIIAMGFLKRFFGRMGSHESITVFVAQGFLDLAHTLFFMSMAILAIPAAGFLIKLH